MAKLTIHRAGGFTVRLADGTVLERPWSWAATPAAAAAHCRHMADRCRQAAAAAAAAAALWDQAGDELDPPQLT